MKLNLFPLPSGNYINLDAFKTINFTRSGEVELEDQNSRMHFLSGPSRDALLAVLNAPVQIAHFVGRGNYQEEATDDATFGANEFLMDLQPWQFINIASQMVYEQPTDTSDECYTHIITLTYRLYRPKTVNTEEAA